MIFFAKMSRLASLEKTHHFVVHFTNFLSKNMSTACSWASPSRPILQALLLIISERYRTGSSYSGPTGYKLYAGQIRHYKFVYKFREQCNSDG